MKTIPILFSTPMVQALQAGTKTQTRRIVKSGIIDTDPDSWAVEGYGPVPGDCGKQDDGRYSAYFKTGADCWGYVICPYGAPGDILWVRETYREYYWSDENGYMDFDNTILEYKADNPEDICLVDGDGFRELDKKGNERFVPWKPSIFMPKSACRLFLKIKSVRVERLQRISEVDAIEEGLTKITKDGQTFKFGMPDSDGLPGTCNTGWAWSDWEVNPVDAYKTLWQSINGPQSWETNPWVWVVEFEKCDKPENF